MTFGRYVNVIEFQTKHANLAMARTVYAAGEMKVVEGTRDSKKGIFWNLDSGRLHFQFQSQHL